MNESLPFAGRIGLVTGAGRRRGIGRAIALALANGGADVVVHAAKRQPSNDEEASGWRGAASVVEEIVALGRRACAIETDLSQRGAGADLIARAEEGLGPVTLLANNAATNIGCGVDEIAGLPDEHWYGGVDVNLHAVYSCCEAAIPAMRKAGGGGIVNISSVVGLRARARHGSYCAAKFAVVGLTQQLALECAPAIRVNCVCPGPTSTDMVEDTFKRTEEADDLEDGALTAQLSPRIPLQRFADPDEMASVVAFLLSERSSFVTGQALVVDGGLDLVNVA